MNNKFYLFFFLIVIEIYALAKDASCFSKKDYKMYHFLNGIKNTDQESRDSSKSISKIFNLNEINPIYNKSVSLAEDLKETFFLKKIEDLKLTRAQNIMALMENPETYKDIQSYLGQLDETKQNYVFTHSEGNLFTNQMCELKDSNLKMDVISFATPSDYLKCNLNKKYALFKQDSVIGWGNLKFPFFKKIDPNYDSDAFIIHKDEKEGWGINLFNHSLSLYLLNEKVVKDLKEKLEKTESEVYSRDYSFNIATIEIQKDNTVNNIINNFKDAKDGLELWGKEKKAFFNVVTYSSDLASKISKKGFIKQILETPIPAQDEQGFADMISYSLNSLNSYCQKVFPRTIQPLCNKVGVKNYFQTGEHHQPELIFDKIKDSKFIVSCEVGSRSSGKSIPIFLNYEKREPVVLFNEKEISINFENEDSVVFNKPIGEISFNQKEDQSISATFIESKIKKSNSVNTQDKMVKCNTLMKLSTKPCLGFLQYLEKKYFSAKK